LLFEAAPVPGLTSPRDPESKSSNLLNRLSRATFHRFCGPNTRGHCRPRIWPAWRRMY